MSTPSMSVPVPAALLKIYVGHAVTGASRTFADKATQFKSRFAGRVSPVGVVYDYLNCSAGVPVDDEAAARHCMRRCAPQSDVMIALVGEASTTLGLEMALALALGIPVFAIAEKEQRLSRIVRRCGTVWTHFQFLLCDNLENDGVELVCKEIEAFNAARIARLDAALSLFLQPPASVPGAASQGVTAAAA